MTLKQWNEIKVWLAPFTAIILWAISVVCFVFGLSFKHPIMVAGFDFTLYIAFAIALCNTAIQLIGNGNMDKDDSGVFAWIWIASYALGIASNTNALLQMLGISSIILEWVVALALGAIIEIAPEKLIMIWLQSVKFNFIAKQQEQKKVTRQEPSGFRPQIKPQNSNYHPAFPPMNQDLRKSSGGGFQKRQALEQGRAKQEKHWYNGE